MQSLLAAARNGDEAAFVGMLAPLLEEAHRLAFAMLQNQHDAEDAVQEAAFNAWRALGRLRDGSNPRPWFLTIVANECRQRRRGRWWRVIKGQPLPDIPGPDPDWGLAAAEVRRAIARLQPDMRLLIVLRYYLDLPFGDMGRVLGISTAAAKLRTHRALRRLRLEVPEDLSDE
jgi:RNA polymerase sigma-70 factor (ECF subfamily)